MRRRGVDWIQLLLLLLAMFAAVAHVEGRISRLEQHVADQDKLLEMINARLESAHPAYRP